MVKIPESFAIQWLSVCNVSETDRTVLWDEWDISNTVIKLLFIMK